MKDKPAFRNKYIIDQLQKAYGVEIAQLEFLPVGDISSAKYRAASANQDVFFLKLVKDRFKEISVTVPYFLYAQGIHQIIPPRKTKDGRLWTDLDGFTCILYPFIEGQNGFQKLLSDDQWIGFGAALKRVHSVNLPPGLSRKIPSKTVSTHWRESVKGFLAGAENKTYQDPVAGKMAAGLIEHRDEIGFVLERAGNLAKALQSQLINRVLCHTDIHAGNLLLDTNNAIYMIDWDDPLMAPKERDLMFIGGGMGGIWNTTREEDLFYRGYGRTEIDLSALTYYRYERIVSDIGEFCQQILSTSEGGADRERSLQKFYSIFLPNQALEIAYQTDLILK
jgi:spectinomycin phosphotransferase